MLFQSFMIFFAGRGKASILRSCLRAVGKIQHELPGELLLLLTALTLLLSVKMYFISFVTSSSLLNLYFWFALVFVFSSFLCLVPIVSNPFSFFLLLCSFSSLFICPAPMHPCLALCASLAFSVLILCPSLHLSSHPTLSVLCPCLTLFLFTSILILSPSRPHHYSFPF
jgi:hypothetical protein